MSARQEDFGIRAAASLSGLKPAMVDYLCRARVLVPTGGPVRPGRGRDRSYTFGDIVMLRALKHLLDCGISVAKLRKGLESLRSHHGEIKRTSLPARYLVTDGRRVYFRPRAKAVEELVSGQLAFAFVVELKTVRDSVLQAELKTGVA
ncbi:MAG: MerR family transcriptional regulator [Candidatus Binataceae bacterium]